MYLADWMDPRVGGHQDLDEGRSGFHVGQKAWIHPSQLHFERADFDQETDCQKGDEDCVGLRETAGDSPGACRAYRLDVDVGGVATMIAVDQPS